MNCKLSIETDMKFFNTSQIKELDQYTIDQEPIASIDLMERAGTAICKTILNKIELDQPVYIFAGPGNNGGDALVLARLLLHAKLNVRVFLLHSGKLSADCEKNRQRLVEEFPGSITILINEFIAPEVSHDCILIDGLFGSGLTRPITGFFADAVNWINSCGCKVLAIDIPSGLQGEENSGLNAPIVKATYTFSLQFPKLAFLLPENEKFVGQWEVLDIGILSKAISETESNFTLLETSDIQSILKNRPKFSHKGTFGHALIIAGSYGMAGASILSGKAALRTGAGLVTVHSCSANRVIIQTSVPEIIFQPDQFDNFISDVNVLEIYNAVAVGPGIGTKSETSGMLRKLLGQLNKPCVLDADALNIISFEKDLLKLIPKNSLLTPHPKEFERLFGKCNSSFERMIKAKKTAQDYDLIIILKGAYTLIALPNGQLIFNSTGNAGMATAGSGDVLTGILAGLLAQGYEAAQAAQLGVFIHGKAADFALIEQSEESMIARDIIDSLGKAFKSVGK